MARTCDVMKLTAEETTEHLSELWEALSESQQDEWLAAHDFVRKDWLDEAEGR